MNLLYIGEIDFCQNNSAAVVRVLNNCKSIVCNGYNRIKLVGLGNKPISKLDSFDVFSVRKGNSIFVKFLNYCFRGFQFVLLINKSKTNTDGVIYYGSSARILIPLIVYCRFNRIKIITDIVEWYDYTHLPFGRFGPIALDVHLTMKILIPACDGIIAISSYLENYYKQKANNIIRVPILIGNKEEMEIDSSIPSFFGGEKIHLIYAGYPGKKESLKNLLLALDAINKDDIKMHLHLVGISKNEFAKLYKISKENHISLYGKLPRAEVKRYLRNADFSVLFRPYKRFANAGFPTKFVESLSEGLPVIANLTSDLNLYLKDGYNGYIAKDDSVSSIIEVLQKINKLDEDMINTFKLNAIESAKIHFSFKLYSEKFDSFFKNLFSEA